MKIIGIAIALMLTLILPAGSETATDRTDIADVPTQYYECAITAVRAGNTQTSKVVQFQFNTNWSGSTPKNVRPAIVAGENDPDPVWITIDFSNGPQWCYTDTKTGIDDCDSFQPNLPSDIGYIDASGLDIITQQDNLKCNYVATFRAPGSQLNGGVPQIHALAAKLSFGSTSTNSSHSHTAYGVVGGIRSKTSVRIPVQDMKAEVHFGGEPKHGHANRIPPGCATGMHLTIQGYGRQCTLVNHAPQ